MRINNPKLYEINTRVWIKRFNSENITLSKIPDEVFNQLSEKGINIIWLMGVWKTCPSTIKKYCYEPFLIKSYNKALKDWKDTDLIGSPFAIDEYEVNPLLGNIEDLKKLRKKLNDKGLRLFLDFIPNHFSADSNLIKSNPEIFLNVDEDIYRNDNHTFYKPNGSDKYFAHGRDPFFPAWGDTIQVNYFSDEAVEFMINSLLKIAECCDGVRCDMAMLALNNVFYNTWSGVLNKMNHSKPEEKFWKKAITRVKEKYPDFIFMAEAYWDLEWELQQLGFDYTYDKKLTDRLVFGEAAIIRQHLLADMDYQRKSVRFIENHDEERAFSLMGKNMSMAAAVIISTIPGIRFYYDGQFEGKKIKLPGQLGREPEEPITQCISDFYKKLLSITKNDIFQFGEWKLLKTLPSWDNNKTYTNLLAWLWTHQNEKRLVIVNYSEKTSQCIIKLDITGYEESLRLIDLLNDTEYLRSAEEVHHTGLYIELKAYQSHIFAY